MYRPENDPGPANDPGPQMIPKWPANEPQNGRQMIPAGKLSRPVSLGMEGTPIREDHDPIMPLWHRRSVWTIADVAQLAPGLTDLA